jgi:hypothetical protein
MNIEHAKHIPISEILSKINIYPQKTTPNELHYLSPWRKEKNASFIVNIPENFWFDSIEGTSGNLITFVCIYLERQNEEHTVIDALRWIKYVSGIISIPETLEKSFDEEDSVLMLKSKRSVSNIGLIHYLKNRGIPHSFAKQYLKEIHVHNRVTDRNFFALGLKNEYGGFEIRNPTFKGSLRPKAITFIRGRVIKPEGIHLFEGMMDYLSAITQRNGKRFRDDAIILHSLSCLKQALPYIHNYGYRFAYTWMDNDPAGIKATDILDRFFKTEESLKHVRMNAVYAPHKDVNDWHVHQIKFCDPIK